MDSLELDLDDAIFDTDDLDTNNVIKMDKS